MAKTNLQYRDAFVDWAHVVSDVKAHGKDIRLPDVTVAITTFNRPDFLMEAVKSALAQKLTKTIEIIIVDNLPESRGFELLAKQIPELEMRNYRYYVHRENIGMFGNFNRSIELARAPWVTILNDDDLLDANCLATLFTEIDKDPTISGISCSKSRFDQRETIVEPLKSARQLSRLTPQFFIEAVRWRVVKYLVLLRTYGIKRSRVLTPKNFFWGAVAGNGAGFMFRCKAARSVGGFRSEEFPTSDLWFLTRFSQQFHLRQMVDQLALVRVATNETSKAETVKLSFIHFNALQQYLLGHVVPRWWVKFTGAILAEDLSHFRSYWRSDVTVDDVEKDLGRKLPKHSSRKMFFLRLVFGGF